MHDLTPLCLCHCGCVLKSNNFHNLNCQHETLVALAGRGNDSIPCPSALRLTHRHTRFLQAIPGREGAVVMDWHVYVLQYSSCSAERGCKSGAPLVHGYVPALPWCCASLHCDLLAARVQGMHESDSTSSTGAAAACRCRVQTGIMSQQCSSRACRHFNTRSRAGTPNPRQTRLSSVISPKAGSGATNAMLPIK